MLIGGIECCTVAELIAHLECFPKDAPVIFRQCSDWSPLEIRDVEYITEEDRRLVYRNDGVRTAYSTSLWGDEKPVYVAAVTFPGN